MMAGSEEGRIQKVFLEPSEDDARSGEVALCLIAKASNCSDIAYEVEDNLIDDERSYDGHPNPSEPVGNVGVL